MDFNAIINAAIKSAVEAQKDELIKQTLKEDHDYIMFKVNKIFRGVIAHLDNICIKYNVDEQTVTKIAYVFVDLQKEIEEAITGKKIEKPVEEDIGLDAGKINWTEGLDELEKRIMKANAEEAKRNWDKCREDNEEEEEEIEEEVDDELIEYQEIPTDKQKRITISFDTLYEAGMWQEEIFKILKSKEDDNVFYIVDMNFSYDINKFEFIKNIEYSNKKAIRIGIGKLLNVKYGDVIGVDVYKGQIMIFNTNSNVNDFDKQIEEKEEKVEEEPKVNISPFRNIVNGIKSKFCKK